MEPSHSIFVPVVYKGPVATPPLDRLPLIKEIPLLLRLGIVAAVCVDYGGRPGKYSDILLMHPAYQAFGIRKPGLVPNEASIANAPAGIDVESTNADAPASILLDHAFK